MYVRIFKMKLHPLKYWLRLGEGEIRASNHEWQ